MRQNSSTGPGIGFIGALTILFIALKLTGVIAWSWWWVLAPIWIPPSLLLGVFAILWSIVALTTGKWRKIIRWDRG